MSLFDPSLFEAGRREPEGSFQIQLWDPGECVWTLGPTCSLFSKALTTAFECLDRGWTLHPAARIVDLDADEILWQSHAGSVTVVANPAYL